MSSTGRGRQKVPFGDYPTPRQFVESIANNMMPRVPAGHMVMDPFAGEGSILKVFKERGCIVAGVEIQPKYQASLESFCDEVAIGDCFELLGGPSDRLDGVTIVTNPDFPLAMQTVQRFATKCDRMLMLTRQGFLASDKRYSMWTALRPRAVYQLVERPVFVWVCKNNRKNEAGDRVCTAPPYPVGWDKSCDTCGSKVGPGSDSNDYVWIEWASRPWETTEYTWLPPVKE